MFTSNPNTDLEEFNNLIDEKQSLERELEELLHEQEKIEEAKKLKLQLQAEPSCGDEFRRYLLLSKIYNITRSPIVVNVK